MRRQPLSQFSFEGGYADSTNPLLAPPSTWAAGSCNQVSVGENVVRPFAGYVSKGSGTGTNYLTQLGSTWGGLKNYSSTTGQGSILETYYKNMYLIGSGKASREGTNITVSAADVTAAPVLQVLSKRITDTTYTYLDSVGLGRVDAPAVVVPAAPSGSYTGVINGAVNFKLAAIRDRESVGSNILSPSAPVKGVASTASAVVVPNNKTVKITFPTALSGQTHWAVFSTKEGFGGTGAFYRVGWRNSSDAAATWYFGIAESTVVAATDRTLEFDYRTGDLLPELAWIQDYAPDPGTHCVQLENIMVVLGCFNGTVGEVSLPNFFESYNPFHKIYFPEAVTAVLHRQVDNYAFVACRNSIHALQYVGYRGDDLPSATIMTVTPDLGIAYQYNWALGGGAICMFIEGTGLVMMGSDGSIDFEFGKEVNTFTRSWTAVNTVIGFNPVTRSFVAGNGDSSVCYCLQTGVWSTPIYNSDAGITGNWVSAINTRGELVATLVNGSTQTAYSYDNSSSTTRIPIASVSQWQQSTLGRSVNIYEGDVAIRQGNNTEPIIIGFHTNLFKTYIRGCSVASSSGTLTAPSGTFTSLYTGMQAAIFGAGIGSKTFTSSDVNTTANTITITAHLFTTGESITLTTSSALPSPLAISTAYYVIVVDANTIKLATSLANALAGTAIDITTGGTGTQTIVVNYLIVKLTYASGTTATMTNRTTGASVTASATVSNVFALVGKDFFISTPNINAEQHAFNVRPAIQNCRTYAMSIWQATDAVSGQHFAASIYGTGSESSVINVT